jgi:hypothetical protein
MLPPIVLGRAWRNLPRSATDGVPQNDHTPSEAALVGQLELHPHSLDERSANLKVLGPCVKFSLARRPESGPACLAPVRVRLPTPNPSRSAHVQEPRAYERAGAVPKDLHADAHNQE